MGLCKTSNLSIFTLINVSDNVLTITFVNLMMRFKCDVTTLVPQVVVGISLKLSALGTGEEYLFSCLWWRRNKEAVGSVLKEFWNTSQKTNTSKQISPCFIAFFVQFFCLAWSESFAREYVHECLNESCHCPRSEISVVSVHLIPSTVLSFQLFSYDVNSRG